MFEELERYAIDNNIPIIEKETKEFLEYYIKENNVKNILEIGSAIGYSALVMANVSKNVRVLTIERDSSRHEEAQENINNYGLAEQIDLKLADALHFKLAKKNKYDLIFIDAAKAQYQKFFEKYSKYLEKDGCVVVDNINFHGFVDGSRKTENRNTKQLVSKIRRFNEWITNNEQFDVNYYDIGDGIFVIKER